MSARSRVSVSSAPRRRRKPSLATRLRIFWIFIAATVGGLGYLAYLLVTLPALRAQTIDIAIDGIAVTRAQVLQAAAIDRTSNVWLLDTAGIERRIEAIPYVDTATVRRSPPGRIVIAVTEREPVACVYAGRAVVTVDASRRILQTGCARSDALAVLVPAGELGPPGASAAPITLARLLADERALRAAGITVRSIEQDRFGGLDAVQTDGFRLLIGSDGDIAAKANLVGPILAATRGGRPIRALDLRAPQTPIVQFR